MKHLRSFFLAFAIAGIGVFLIERYAYNFELNEAIGGGFGAGIGGGIAMVLVSMWQERNPAKPKK